MKQTVTITIDGVKIKTAKGKSVLDAAIEYGICIPHLCHLETLSEIGACRLCIVEHVKNGRSTVTTSCTLAVQEGMVINSNTPKIKKLRHNIAELLVAEAPNSRAVQDVALRCGVTDVRYPFRNNNCVLCGRCVRLCNELWGARAIGFVGRGAERRVGFPFGKKPDYCKQCEACIIHCPMSITPCDGPMKTGEEYLCGKCEAQLQIANQISDSCIWCELGKGFSCSRYQ